MGTTLVEVIGIGDTTIKVKNINEIPEVGFYIEIDWDNTDREVMLVMGKDISGKVEVERGKGGTTRKRHGKRTLVREYKEASIKVQAGIMDLSDAEQILVPSEIEDEGSKSLNVYTDTDGNLVVVSNE